MYGSMQICLVQAKLIGPLLLAATQTANTQLSANVQYTHTTQLNSVIQVEVCITYVTRAQS
jgi:hypothetical protein